MPKTRLPKQTLHWAPIDAKKKKASNQLARGNRQGYEGEIIVGVCLDFNAAERTINRKATENIWKPNSRIDELEYLFWLFISPT